MSLSNMVRILSNFRCSHMYVCILYTHTCLHACTHIHMNTVRICSIHVCIAQKVATLVGREGENIARRMLSDDRG